MKKSLFALVTLLLWLLTVSNADAQADEDPCAEAMTTVEMQECLQTRYAKADAELNEIYKQLKAKLSTERMAKLREAQRAWIQFRDRSADFEASEEEGGSMQSLIYVSVQAEMTEQRAQTLQLILDKLQ